MGSDMRASPLSPLSSRSAPPEWDRCSQEFAEISFPVTMLENFKCFDCEFGCCTELELISHCEASGTAGHRKRWLCVPCLAAFPSELAFNQHCQYVDVPAHRYCSSESCDTLFATIPFYRAHCVSTHGVVVPLVPPGVVTGGFSSASSSPEAVERGLVEAVGDEGVDYCDCAFETQDAPDGVNGEVTQDSIYETDSQEDISEVGDVKEEEGERDGRDTRAVPNARCGEGPLRCFDCEFRCRTEPELASHCECTSHRKRWLCVPCLAAFPYEVAFNQHCQYLDVPAHRYCNSCNVLYSTILFYQEHCSSVHQLAVPFVPPRVVAGGPRTTGVPEEGVQDSAAQAVVDQNNNEYNGALEDDADDRGPQDRVPGGAEAIREDREPRLRNTRTTRDSILEEAEVSVHDVKSETHAVERHDAPVAKAVRRARDQDMKLRYFKIPASFSFQDRLKTHCHITDPLKAPACAPSKGESPSHAGAKERHCAPCNIYFGNVSRLNLHNLKVHSDESSTRRMIDYTLPIGGEYVESPKWEIESAHQKELEAQELIWIGEERLMQERWERELETQEYCPVSQTLEAKDDGQGKPCAKPQKWHPKGNAKKAVNASWAFPLPRKVMESSREDADRGSPSIGIIAIIPAGGGGWYLSQHGPLLNAGPRGTKSSKPERSGSADGYCPICRIPFRSTHRYDKHVAKVHKDFEGDLARAETKRREKAEQQRLNLEAEEKRRQAEAAKSQGKGKAKTKSQPLCRPNARTSECIECCIKFSTCELLDDHIHRYRELGLSHRSVKLVAHQTSGRGVVVVKKPPRKIWAWQTLIDNKATAGSMQQILPLQVFNRMRKRIRLQRRVEKEKTKKTPKDEPESWRGRRSRTTNGRGYQEYTNEGGGLC